MSKPLKHLNQAENKLTVGSLEVLQDISGNGIKTIKQSISQIQNSVTTLSEKTSDYWRDIASDNIITPGEKSNLKKEWNTLSSTYYEILKTAEDEGKGTGEPIRQLSAIYEELHNYLYATLRVFSNMAENTEIPDPDTYYSLFNTYYTRQQQAQFFLAEGAQAPQVLAEYSPDGMGNWSDVFDSRIHKYMRLSYDDGATWSASIRLVGEDGSFMYKGIVNTAEELPPVTSGVCFLANANIQADAVLALNNKLLKVNGLKLQVKRLFRKGYIYTYQNNRWEPVYDKNDYRYILALNDLLAIGGDISPNLKQTIADQIPSYRGVCEEDPANPKVGDFFTWDGLESTERRKGYIYKREVNQVTSQEVWEELSTTDPNNYQYYMQALPDILNAKKTNLEPGYFSVIFAKALMANTAFINELATQIITLQNGGYIQSKVFGENTGFKLEGDTGKLIAQNVELKGKIVATSGEFTGNINATSGTFTGDIKARGLDFYIEPGENELFTIYHRVRQGGASNPETKFYISDIPFSGTAKFVMSMKDNSTGGVLVDTTYKLLINNNVAASYNFPKGSETYTRDGTINVNFGDTITCVMENYGGTRFSNADLDVSIKMKNTSYLLKSLCKQNLITWP